MQKLKAIEILQAIANDKKDSEFKNKYEIKTESDLRNFVKEVIKELEEYEQNFKQKEFDYRTQCQNVLSAARLETDEQADRLAELEKVILDYYLDKGYQVGVGKWEFIIGITAQYKIKRIYINFYDEKEGGNLGIIFTAARFTTKEIFDEAIKHFSLNAEPLQEDTKPELDDTNQSAIYKIAGYESDGRE